MKDKYFDKVIKSLSNRKSVKIKVPKYDARVMMAHWSNGYN